MKVTDQNPPFRTADRAGFSLVEIMVVLVIIGILAALTSAAAMQILGRQRISNTEVLIKKLASILDKQWQAVVDQARKEEIPSEFLNGQVDPSTGKQISWGLLQMAGGNPDRARVIWVKLRLKQQFPMTYIEALSPAPGPPGSLITIVFSGPKGPGALPYIIMPPEPAYWRALKNGTAKSTNPAQEFESAALLLLALSQNRRGVSFDPESLAPPETAVAPKLVVDAPDMKMVVDAWGTPLGFYRWPVYSYPVPNTNPAPYQNEPAYELDQSNPAKSGTSATLRDPLDPQGLLLDPTWNNATNYNNHMGVWAFELLCHPVHIDPNGAIPLPTNPNQTYSGVPHAFYSVPVIVSAGKNEINTPGQGFGLQRFNGFFPNPMILDPKTYANGNDNIYSFRLRLGARGD